MNGNGRQAFLMSTNVNMTFNYIAKQRPDFRHKQCYTGNFPQALPASPQCVWSILFHLPNLCGSQTGSIRENIKIMYNLKNMNDMIFRYGKIFNPSEEPMVYNIYITARSGVVF